MLFPIVLFVVFSLLDNQQKKTAHHTNKEFKTPYASLSRSTCEGLDQPALMKRVFMVPVTHGSRVSGCGRVHVNTA